MSKLGVPQRRSGGHLLASFFTIARFEPDSMAILASLIFATVVLLVEDLTYLSLVTTGILVVIFLVESFENIKLDHVEDRQIVGARCLVVKRVSITERGIARLFKANGSLDPELWSVEASSPLMEGEVALVSAMRSVILEVVPLPKD